MADEWTVDEKGEPKKLSGRATFAMSASIGALAGALAKAQGEIVGAGKDKLAKVRMKSGGEYSYKYADLASIIDACRAPLATNGLALMQPVNVEGRSVTVTTILAHASGEWIRSDLTMIAMEPGPQAAGSAITYGRKYGLMALVGVAGEDDDGAAAQGARGDHDSRRPPPAPGPDMSKQREAMKEKEPTDPEQPPSDAYAVLYSARVEIMDGEKPEVAGHTLDSAEAWVAAVKQAKEQKAITAQEFALLREFHKKQTPATGAEAHQ